MSEMYRLALDFHDRESAAAFFDLLKEHGLLPAAASLYQADGLDLVRSGVSVKRTLVVRRDGDCPSCLEVS
jgi:hypothetical protein